MIRQATVLGLLLAAGLNATPVFTAQAEFDCASKRQVLQDKLAAAEQRGDKQALDGLRRALGNVDAYCDDVSLHRQRLASVEEARQAVQEHEQALREALGEGDQEKIAQRQAELAEARAELQQAQAEAEAEVDQ
ncbi:DUF1090 domain-containing protein [Pseudomonas sp. NCHU5208]|uniref:DUF1090 domain-containing protein n=1 Tax=unclassified Pseudomonas TaxID=196821 RepID=UPI003F9A586B